MRRNKTERQLLVSRVKALAEALEGSEVSELDLTESGVRVLIRRRMEPVMAAPVVRRTAGRGARVHRSRLDGAASSVPAPDPGVAVTAPLTGVFYGASSPTSAAFVQVGEIVQAGQIVCIVEAMKVFNEIKSEISGTVTAVLPQDGQLVQKGDVLIRVKPA